MANRAKTAKPIQVKCPICKETLNKTDGINCKNRYYHKDCYEIKLKEDEIKQNEVHEKALSRQLTDWLMVQYNITRLSSYFCLKLARVYNGTEKNMSKPIPCEDLFYMWKSKLEELDKIAENNRRKGIEIIGENRLNYDLAVLIGKYDKYLAWKNKHKIEQIEKTDVEKTIKIVKTAIEFNSNRLTPKRISIKKEVESINIGDMLDEI